MPIVRALLAVLCLASVMLRPAHAENRVALVIGNSAYVNAPALANPANDAKAMAASLKALGFKVVLGLDLDKSHFEKTLRTFTKELETAEAGLLYYAGHGLQVSGQNYLVPVDASLAVERDLDFEAIRLDFVLKQMELDRDGKTNIVFLDACRDNPLAKNLARTMGTRSVAISQGLAEAKTGVGTFIAYSTQPGNVALDGTGANSPFASALAQRVREPDQSLNSVMIKVRNDVLALTQGKQVPWDHSALTGDFYFARAGDQSLAKPGVSNAPIETQALRERIGRLEDDLKRKSDASSLTASATLLQLKQRHRQLEDDNRRDLDHLFSIQRGQAGDRDPQKRMSATLEIGRLQIEMSRRSKDISDLKAEIAKIEPEGDPPATPAAAK